MTDASARGRSNRNRGAAAERELARWIRDELGIDVARNLKAYQQSQEGDLTPVGPFLIECKYWEEVRVERWWKQASEQAKKAGLIPVVAYKVSRKGWRFVLPYTTNIPGPAQSWRYDYEYTMDVGPECFAMIVREAL